MAERGGKNIETELKNPRFSMRELRETIRDDNDPDDEGDETGNIQGYEIIGENKSAHELLREIRTELFYEKELMDDTADEIPATMTLSIYNEFREPVRTLEEVTRKADHLLNTLRDAEKRKELTAQLNQIKEARKKATALLEG